MKSKMEYTQGTQDSAYQPGIQWIEVLAGPVLWTIHFLLVYFLVEFGCRFGFLGSIVLGLRGLVWVILLATLLALAILVYAGWKAYQQWKEIRRSQDEPTQAGQQGALPLVSQRSELMTLAGWVLALFFGPLILLAAIPPLLLPTCPWT